MKNTGEEKEINQIRRIIEKGTKMILTAALKKAEAEELMIKGAKMISEARQRCGHQEIKDLCDLCTKNEAQCETCKYRVSYISICIICGERVKV